MSMIAMMMILLGVRAPAPVQSAPRVVVLATWPYK